MEDTIIGKKNQLIDIVQGIVNDYNIMYESKIQKACETDLELRRLNDIIREQESNSEDLLNKFKDCEDNNQKLKKQLFEYETMIKNLQDKIIELETQKEEEDKFTIVRKQADEISAKDREIDRLNHLIINLKESKKDKKSKKIDQVMGIVEEKVNEEDEQEEDEQVEEDEQEEDEQEDEENIITFLYKSKEYCYIEDDKSYSAYLVEDGKKGELVGKWGQTKTGRKKLMK